LAFDEKIYELRREKLKQIEALGLDPYPRRYETHKDHTIGYIRDRNVDKTAEELEAQHIEVQVAGRIMAIRLMGKAGFAHLQSTARLGRTGTKKLQIYVKREAVSEKGFQLFKLLDIGDIVGVRGYLFKTRTGELTLHVEDLTLLAKDLLPLPEKWHGLTDVELRYRQRYVDLAMNPEVREVFLKRTELIKSLRRFLDDHWFVEVETPMMQPIAGGAVARPFVTHHNTLDMDLYLRIAPELYLKRLLVGGFDRVYEINRNFRNEGLGWRWNPEFTMLEFYQAYTDYQGVMDLTQELITQAAKDVTKGKDHPDGITKTKWGDQEIDWANWHRMTMREAISRFWPEGAGPKPTRAELASAAALSTRLFEARTSLHSAAIEAIKGEKPEVHKRYLDLIAALGNIIHINIEKEQNVGKAVASLFEAVAEEHLTQPTIIYEFPTAVSPLSKQKPDEPEWTERWEIYAGKMEIANGFSELNDPVDQRRRFEAQLTERERGDLEAHQMDEDYIRALSYGMPPAGGVGVGVDRLAMLLTDSHTIRDVILFPLLRPEKNLTTEDTGEKP
jgi:lysyl-tRNA synthetase class 2